MDRAPSRSWSARRLPDGVAHNATARQVALRFLLRHPSVFVIPKASRVEHVIENAGAGMLRLTDAELARIDAAFPRGPRPRELPVL
jgi:diketogulonate reductase-like aldo/keto reductase